MNVTLPIGIVVSHMDDESLMSGALLSRYSTACHVLVLTDSVSSTYVVEHLVTIAQIRRRTEFNDALKVLGVVSSEVHHFPDSGLFEVKRVEVFDCVKLWLIKNSIKTVVTHHPVDLNDDHQVLCEVVTNVASYLDIDLLYGEPERSVGSWKSDIILRMSDEEARSKLLAISSYTSEIERGNISFENLHLTTVEEKYSLGRGVVYSG